MLDDFKIYIDRLSNGRIETLSKSLSPKFLEVSDGNLEFPEMVSIEGVAYLAEDHLVLAIDLATEYKTHCKICNEWISLPFIAKGVYITEELEKIPSRVFDFESAIRDTILIEIPLYGECNGNCSMREDLKKFFVSEA